MPTGPTRSAVRGVAGCRIHGPIDSTTPTGLAERQTHKLIDSELLRTVSDHIPFIYECNPQTPTITSVVPTNKSFRRPLAGCHVGELWQRSIWPDPEASLTSLVIPRNIQSFRIPLGRCLFGHRAVDFDGTSTSEPPGSISVSGCRWPMHFPGRGYPGRRFRGHVAKHRLVGVPEAQRYGDQCWNTGVTVRFRVR